MDAGFDANQAELGVFILAELLKMLADSDGLLDQVVQILGNLGSKTASLQDSENFAAGDSLNLGDSVRVSKGNADLRRGRALLGELNDLFAEVVGADLDPGWRGFSVG